MPASSQARCRTVAKFRSRVPSASVALAPATSSHAASGKAAENKPRRMPDSSASAPITRGGVGC